MSQTNSVTIAGNLTRDPELRFTPSGSAVTSLSIAVNRRWQNQQTQEWEEEVSFFDCVAWSDLAENIAVALTKGDRVVVIGRLMQRTWETAEGDKRSKVEIVADDVSPSLRWATATVVKNERKQAPSAGKTTSYDDEEPF